MMFSVFRKTRILTISKNALQILFRNMGEKRRVVVTGLGCVCPSGENVHTAWSNIINGVCSIQKLEDPQYDGLPCRVGGLVDVSKVRGYDTFQESGLISGPTKYAFIAAAEAITDAGLDMDNPSLLYSTGTAIGCSSFDVGDFVKSYKNFQQNGYDALDSYAIIKFLQHMPTSMLGFKYRIQGPILSPNAGTATGTITIGQAYRVIRHRKDVDIMICGSTEFGMHPYILAVMCRFGLLTTKFNDRPHEACRPFDIHRDGEVTGEGAGVLILEEMEHAMARGARIYCEIRGFSVTTGYLPKSDREIDKHGLKEAMRKCLLEANILPDYVSYVNANGSSGLESDFTEALSIQDLFGDRSWELFVSSTKGAHGNLLGAAGSVETVFLCMAIYEGILPPTLNVDMTKNEFTLNFIPEIHKKYYSRRKITLKNSRSINGVSASLCLCHFDPSSAYDIQHGKL